MNDKLKHALEELLSELQQIGLEDPKIQKLADDVQGVLKNGARKTPQLDSIRDATEGFEMRHPQLTAMINNIMNSLSNIGI